MCTTMIIDQLAVTRNFLLTLMILKLFFKTLYIQDDLVALKTFCIIQNKSLGNSENYNIKMSFCDP